MKMADNRRKSEASADCTDSKRAKEEDSQSWLEALANYVKETEADVLNLEGPGLGIEEVSYILNFLPDSQVTELNLMFSCLTNGMVDLAPLLIKTKVKKLNVRECFLSNEDLLQLARVLKHSQVTDLGVSKSVSFNTKEGRRCMSYLQESKLLRLTGGFFHFSPQTELTSFFKEFLKTSITCLDFRFSYLHSNDLIFLFKNLAHSSVTDLKIDETTLSSEAVEELSRRLADTKIEKLNLRAMNLKDEQLVALAEGLVNSKVVDLDLSQNEFSSFSPLFTKLKETQIKTLNLQLTRGLKNELFSNGDFRDCSLTSLNLSRCNLSDEAGETLMESLRFSNVSKLDISHNAVGSLTIAKFIEHIKLINLTDLDISANPLSRDVFFSFGGCLKDSKLEQIDVSALTGNTCLCLPSICATDQLTFLKLTEGSSVIKVNIGRYDSHCFPPPVAGPEIFCKTTFTELHLPLCGIGDSVCDIGDSVSNLMSHLKYSSVTYLNLVCNRISAEGAAAIAACLPETQIRRLNLDSNSIMSEGAKALALSFKDSNLLYLHLRGNKIGDDGLEALAKYTEDTFITELDVSRNQKKGYRRKMLSLEEVLLQNKVRVHKLVSIFKQIAPKTNSDEFSFDQKSDDSDVSTFLVKCMGFYKTVISNPRAINVLLEEKSEQFSREQIFKLVCEEFPRQFSDFVACRIEADVLEHVKILEKAEEMGLTAVVEAMLLNRPIYTLDEGEGIMHPYVYSLLLKYKQPICSLTVEPRGLVKIIDYFTEHSDIEGAGDVINLLLDAKIL